MTLRLRPGPDGALAPGDLARLGTIFAAGGVAATPAEASYGLSVPATNAAGVAAIARLKGSRSGRSFLVALGELSHLELLGIRLAAAALDALRRVWPAPLTVVLPVAGGIAADLAGSGTLAVRLPADPVLRRLALDLGTPLVTTSANREGEPPCLDPGAILETWPEGLDAVVDDGPRPGGLPSTLVDLTGPEPVLLRPGAWAMDRSALRGIFTTTVENPVESA